MSKPFHLPSEFGKLGNWLGSLNFNQAQTILIEASQRPQGAKFVELGFDGGRSTVVLNWAASQVGASIDVVSVTDPEASLWFKRAVLLFKMDRKLVVGHMDLAPKPCDLLLINPGVARVLPAVFDWLRLVDLGGVVISVGEPLGAPEGGFKRVVQQPGLEVYHREQNTERIINRAIDSVVKEFSKKGDGPLDNNQRAKLHGLRGGKKRDGEGNGADTKVHAPVEPDQGSELLPS